MFINNKSFHIKIMMPMLGWFVDATINRNVVDD